MLWFRKHRRIQRSAMATDWSLREASTVSSFYPFRTRSYRYIYSLEVKGFVGVIFNLKNMWTSLKPDIATILLLAAVSWTKTILDVPFPSSGLRIWSESGAYRYCRASPLFTALHSGIPSNPSINGSVPSSQVPKLRTDGNHRWEIVG